MSKLMTSQSGQQTIIIHIFFNISRSKGKQTMKFGQERIVKKISFRKQDRETSSSPPFVFSSSISII